MPTRDTEEFRHPPFQWRKARGRNLCHPAATILPGESNGTGAIVQDENVSSDKVELVDVANHVVGPAGLPKRGRVSIRNLHLTVGPDCPD